MCWYRINLVFSTYYLKKNTLNEMHAKRKLTDLSIKQAILKAKDSTKTVKTSDGGGMYLQIQPNGSK